MTRFCLLVKFGVMNSSQAMKWSPLGLSVQRIWIRPSWRGSFWHQNNWQSEHSTLTVSFVFAGMF